MSERSSRSLQSAGLAAMTPRGSLPEGSLQVNDVERRLARYSRKPNGKSQNLGMSGPSSQTACTLLEENQRLSTIKNQNKKMDRKASKELVDEILERDRQNLEYDRKKQEKRRETHQALAQKYRAAILQKEMQESQEYEKKKASGPGEEFFPFTEGETVEQHRLVQNSMLRCEMQAHLKEQQERQPVRHDALMASVSHQHPHLYGNSLADTTMGKHAVAPHIGNKHPLFLRSNREHMSRRINDAHITEAMNCKVEIFKGQLEQLAAERHREARQHEEGLMINDALRYDNAVIKAHDRQKNAEFLKVQMKEQEKRAEMELKEQRSSCCGYFGPEEKNLQPSHIHENHCRHLISQMETDQHRRLDDKHRRLQEEKQIVNNTMQVMFADKHKAIAKAEKHKKVLTKTWDNQKKIRSAMDHVDRIGG